MKSLLKNQNLNSHQQFQSLVRNCFFAAGPGEGFEETAGTELGIGVEGKVGLLSL
jgi:hypothetical protein